MSVVKSGFWLAVGVGAYLAFTLSSFPAGVAYAWFAPPDLELAGVEGTFWSGRAAGGNVGELSLREIRWRVHPWQLLLGRIAAEVRAQLTDGFVSAEVKATRSRVELSDVRASTSLPALLRNVPLLAAMRGDASLSLTKLEIDNGWPTKVVGELKLARLETVPLISSGARVKLVPIGDYVVRFVDGAGGLHATFNDTGGPLEVSGTLVVDGARAFTLDCLIKPRADAPQELVDGIKAQTADPDAEGRFHLTQIGSL